MSIKLPAKLINHPLWEASTIPKAVKSFLSTTTRLKLSGIILATFATTVAVAIVVPVVLISLVSVVALVAFTFMSIKGYAHLQFKMAKKFEEGTEGTPVDYQKAFTLFSKAADLGHTEAQFRLSKYYLEGKNCAVDINKGMELIRQSAVNGLPAAQMVRANFLIKGINCPQNIEEGFKLVKKLADDGFIPAAFTLAEFYKDQPLAEITKCNPSITTAQEAAEASKKLYTEVVNAKVTEVVGMTPSETNNFVSQANYTLAKMRESELRNSAPVELNPEVVDAPIVNQPVEAAVEPRIEEPKVEVVDAPKVEEPKVNAPNLFALYSDSAKLDHAKAQFELAGCYFEGIDCEVDFEKGFESLKKAADHGLLLAQVALADCYFSGRGCEIDVEQGFDLITKLAEKGYLPAKFSLVQFYLSNRLSDIALYDPSIESYFEATYKAKEICREIKNTNPETIGNLTPDEASRLIKAASTLYGQIDFNDEEEFS